jgi:hypothetical protein
MGRVIDPNSAEGKELQKWEMHNSHWQGEVIPAGNPFRFQEYPKMLYKAQQRMETGKVECMMAPPNPYQYTTQQEYDRACLIADRFNMSCQKTVRDAYDEGIAKGQGWCLSAKDALEAHERQEQAIAELAAKAAYHAQGMSEQARAELKAADGETHQHVVDIVGKKRGRKPKAVVAVDEEM